VAFPGALVPLPLDLFQGHTERHMDSTAGILLPGTVEREVALLPEPMDDERREAPRQVIQLGCVIAALPELGQRQLHADRQQPRGMIVERHP
jgi:hypothetical protein